MQTRNKWWKVKGKRRMALFMRALLLRMQHLQNEISATNAVITSIVIREDCMQQPGR
jgi:hypothetical protein